MSKKISGTREWAAHTVNCITGCEHNCRYCYARANALRFRYIASPDDWATPRVRLRDVNKTRRKVDGRIMFPTTHDITPKTLAPCLCVLRNLLGAGNEVLIVTKPHFECVERICSELCMFRKSILWRFTIGAMDNRILSYWEPGAPCYKERFRSLQYAFCDGFATSVSCEPCLDTSSVVALFSKCEPFITDSFWIGKANKLAGRCSPDTLPCEIENIEAEQTDEIVRRIYEQLKHEPKIRWKESFKSVLGLELAAQAGEDK